jgi:saccharopine dehydrogenase-like NADP-dependent oxidoreductase
LISFFNARAANDDDDGRTVALRTIVKGVLSGVESVTTCDLVAEPNDSWGVPNATAYLTGVAGSIFGQILAEGKVQNGVLAPEIVVSPEEFQKELEKRKIKIEKTVSRKIH